MPSAIGKAHCFNEFQIYNIPTSIFPDFIPSHSYGGKRGEH